MRPIVDRVVKALEDEIRILTESIRPRLEYLDRLRRVDALHEALSDILGQNPFDMKRRAMLREELGRLDKEREELGRRVTTEEEKLARRSLATLKLSLAILEERGKEGREVSDPR